MHLVLVFLNRPDQPERVLARLREAAIADPLFIRARSTAAALSAEVPVFAGLRSLALGADEDRLVLVSLKSFPSPEEAGKVISRLQLELDADTPPSGRVVALPVVSAGHE